MRLAVLISGEYREFEIAVKSWDFLKYNPDCYFSTWNTTSEFNSKLNININETVTEERIRKYLPNAIVKIEDQDNFGLIFNYEKMIYKWMSVIKLMVDSGKQYDAVILIRPDIFICYDTNKFEDFIVNMEDDLLYGLNPANKITTFMQDLMFCGKQKEIEKLLLLPLHELTQPNINIHWWLAVKFKKLFSNIKNFNFFHPRYPACIVRSSARLLPENEINGASIEKVADEWYYTRHNNTTLIKEFNGFSGSKIFLLKNMFPIDITKEYYLVRKEGNIERNYEKLKVLYEEGFDVPKIFHKNGDSIDMQFILGDDIKSFLDRRDISELWNFIKTTIDRFRKTSIKKDYTDTYKEFLEEFRGDKFLPFTVDQLLDKLPKELDCSLCHGDFTFENLIYKNGKFYMIDASTGIFDSWIFDLAKLRQDIDGRWFLRNEKNKNAYKIEIKFIRDKLLQEYPEVFNDYLYILMLLRVYKYSHNRINERLILLNELRNRWK